MIYTTEYLDSCASLTDKDKQRKSERHKKREREASR